VARAGRRSFLTEASEYAEAILVAVLVALFFKTYVVEAYGIPSGSMEPHLLPGDHIIVNKFVFGAHEGPWARFLPHRDIRRGDVIVFRYPPDPSRDFVKRAMGLPGETVQIAAKKLLIGGQPVDDPEAVFRDPDVVPEGPDVPPSVAARDHWGPRTLPPDAYLALGDNRDDSQDSRFWGPVPRGYVKGRAVFVYWSFEESPDAREIRGRGATLRRFLDNALNFFGRTRWRRTGLLIP
jgi:signal peptidase I